MILRELARAVARRQGVGVTFAPIVAGMGVGNGVHVHLGLVDREGRPVMHDPAGPGGLSAIAGSFTAGILRHLPALLAFTAASTVSYQRLVPHRWSSSFNNLGYRDREAAVRICPVREDGDVAAQYHVEYRAADAVASPYLLLAMLAMAGLQGLREELPTPRPTEGDLATMGAAELQAQGVQRLPTSFPLALAALDADADGPGLAAAAAAGLLPEAQAERDRGHGRPVRRRAGGALRSGLLTPPSGRAPIRISSRLIKGATLKVYPGPPHGLMVTSNDQLNNDLLAYIRS